ncbi:hypothetical protein ACTFIU_009939 [Dictyostelium citrinum]
MKLMFLLLLLIISINFCINIYSLELIEIKYDNNNCEGKPSIIKFCCKNSNNGKVEIIGFNNKTGNKIITQTFDEGKKVYTNEINVCIPEGDISFYFILHENKNQLSIPKSANNEYCNEIQLLEYDINKRQKQCYHNALIISYKNETCVIKDKNENTFYRFICDQNNGNVKRYSCNNNCQDDWSSCKLDTIPYTPKLMCPHFKEKSLEKLIKK